MTRFHSYALCTFCIHALAGCQPGLIGESQGTTDANSPVDSSSQTPDAFSPTPDAGTQPDASPGVPDATPSVPDAAPPPCVEGDIQVVDPQTGHCYMGFLGVLEWEQARDTCADIGAHLVDITSETENLLVVELTGTAVPDWWTGGNDRASEGEWVWLNGDSLGYTKWRAGEPNNSTGSDPVNGEDCGVIEVDTAGTWDDRPCTMRTYPFVCERD